MAFTDPPRCSRSAPRAVLTKGQAVEIYSFGKTIRLQEDKSSMLHENGPAGVAKRYNVSPKAIRDIWNRRTWTQETEHLWEVTDKPISRIPELLSSLRTAGIYRFCSAGFQGGRLTSHRKRDQLALPTTIYHCEIPIKDHDCLPNSSEAHLATSMHAGGGPQFQQDHVYAISDLQTSSPSFADVTSHGISSFRNKTSHIRAPSSFPPDYAQGLRAASPAAPPPAAALPPPIAPWALGPAGCFSDCAGVCAVCGAPCCRARADGRGAAALDDPSRPAGNYHYGAGGSPERWSLVSSVWILSTYPFMI
jgi:hypothetical protein